MLAGYWQAGRQLFKDDTNPASRLAGVRTLFTDMAADPGAAGCVNLRNEGLEGSVSFVYALAVLHVLSRQQCVQMLKRVHDMLLPDKQLKFLSAYTGITDLESLRQHVLLVWQEVKKNQHVYCCIQAMSFLAPKVQDHPQYKAVLAASALHKQQQQQSGGGSNTTTTPLQILDLGCCFGQDTRQLLMDGIPAGGIIASDIHDGYWQAGRQLFKDDTNPASRLAGVRTLFTDMAADPGAEGCVDLSAEGLEGSVSFVYALAVLHVLSRQQCVQMLQRVHDMLLPGVGTFFGWTVGAEVEAEWAKTPTGEAPRYLHSKASLAKLFEELGYDEVSVTEADFTREVTQSAGMQKLMADGAVPRTRLSFVARRKALQ
ncbi:MAG: hypothetical protein WDW38_005095 [Sanguina aurantia]